jgi:hypothetical protein
MSTMAIFREVLAFKFRLVDHSARTTRSDPVRAMLILTDFQVSVKRDRLVSENRHSLNMLCGY